jgi:segregation and condensation protein B
MEELSAKIEAMLFFKSEPLSLAFLVKELASSEEQVSKALENLESGLRERGIVLMRKEDSFQLATAPAYSPLIEKLEKDDLSRDIGRAGLETLSIILYAGPISRSELDYIRGVNSQFIVRNLLVRGLVERVQSKKDLRSFLYRPTFKLLAYLGIERLENLPDYEEVQRELSSIKAESFEDNRREAGKSDDEIIKDLSNEGDA